MEENMFPRTVVRSEMEKMVRVQLYTDPPDNALRDKNVALMKELGKTLGLPLYVILNSDRQVIATSPYETDESKFVAFLKKGTEP